MQSPEHPQGPWSLHRAIIEQAEDAVIFIDPNGIIGLWNRGAEIIFGYAASEVMGRSIDVIIPERFRKAHDEGFHKAMLRGATRHPGRVMTTRACHKFVSHLYVDMSFGMLKDEAGAVLGAFAIARDCTTRHLESVARKSKPPAQAQPSLH